MAIQKIVTDDALSAFASDVKAAIANVSSPLVYKGTLGTGGTISTLPAASASNNGFAYVVITAGTYQGVVCAVGDVIASNGTAWNIIPQTQSAESLPITTGSAVNTKEYIDTKTTLVKSASGDLITISDGSDNIPLKSCEVTINPDLSGKTECNLVVCGKNLFEVTATTQTKNNVTFTVNSNGTVTANNTANGTSVLILGTITLNQGNYTLNGTDTNGGQGKYGLGLYDENDTLLNTDFGSGITFTVTEKTTYKIGIRYWYGITYSNVLFSPMLRPSSITDSTFEQYNGTTYTTTFGTTVYGGEGDMLSGEFISNYAFIDENDFNMASGTTSGGLHYFNIKSALNGRISGKVEVICNELPYLASGGWASTTPCISSYESSGAVDIRIYCASTSIEDFKTTYANLQIIYPIDNGTTLSLTPTSPKTISGINNIYNDCGSTEIEYFTESADEVADLIRTQPAPMVHYSLSEQEIGTWIDGSTLYEKTIVFGALPNTTTKSVNHNISNLDKVAFLNGIAYKSGDIIPIPFSHSSNVSNQTQLSIGNTTVNIRTANDQSDRTGYITVRYTKSS